MLVLPKIAETKRTVMVEYIKGNWAGQQDRFPFPDNLDLKDAQSYFDRVYGNLKVVPE